MFLSIIIPIYNVERYVRGTLESIYSQDCGDDAFEVICVNDGTPDGSMAIVDEFASLHANLRIINQSNQGLSCARNAGLAVAKGDYVWFVDSDDTLAPGALTMVKTSIVSSGADVTGFDMLRKNERTGDVTIEKIAVKQSVCYGVVAPGTTYYDRIHTCPVQRFVFSRTFLETNGLKFYPHIYYEDAELMVRVLCLVKRMMIISATPYCYLVRGRGSIMSSAYRFAFTQSVLTRIANWRAMRRDFLPFSLRRQMLDDAIFCSMRSIITQADFADSDFRTYYKANRLSLRLGALHGLSSLRYGTMHKLVDLPFMLLCPKTLKWLESSVNNSHKDKCQ